MNWFTDISFTLNKAGVDFIHILQKSYPQSVNYFQTVTETANPQYAFTILFPVFSVLNPHLSIKVLMTAMLSEWINALLKWLLMGHRPYWWVREVLEEIQPLRTPQLQQTPFTCETGPGNPSGHVMSFASIVYILVSALLPIVLNNKSRNTQKTWKAISWSLYAVAIVLISISRLYVAAHFPHQCVLGAFIGLGLGYLVEVTSPQWMTQWKRSKLLKGVAVIWLSAFGGYWGQRLLGVDPQWSVKLAFKWCNLPENVHVSTTPIFALTRDCGTALGLALALSAMPALRQANSRLEFIATGTVQSVGVVITLWLAQIGKSSAPTKDARLFYLCIMLLNAATPFLLLVSIPKFTNFLSLKVFGKYRKKYD